MPDRGEAIELSIEKPAAGGRMLARHNGKVVFVHGAIPGERVRARLERVERQLSFASVSEILEPSPDRRQPATDLLCGGCTYAHIVYPRQLTLKAELIQEAFARLGKVPLDAAVVVQPSPEHGYRLKARFHVSAGRVGFYREATHELCDAATTGQLREDSVTAAIASVEAAIAIAPLTSAELSENISADERVMYLEGHQGEIIPATALEAAMNAGGFDRLLLGVGGRGTSRGHSCGHRSHARPDGWTCQVRTASASRRIVLSGEPVLARRSRGDGPRVSSA